MAVQIVNIGSASDGTGAAPNVGTMTRNDNYFLEKIAERYVKERGIARPGVTYRLPQLPAGFGGYEKAREGSKHVDRYLYGHPNGIFRSLNELWPHFDHLERNGGPIGCPCKLCTGTGKGAAKKSSRSGSTASGSPSERSTHFGGAQRVAKPGAKAAANAKPFKSSLRDDNPQGLPQGRLDSKSPTRPRPKPANDEGAPDIYSRLLTQLRAEPQTTITENVIDQLSPDWRAGNELLQNLLTEWQSQPSYVPRLGEVVLFARNASEDTISWDPSSQVLRRIDTDSRIWLGRLKWEAGVITQMPDEPVTDRDLAGVPSHKRNVTYSGFRIEPVPEPSNEKKPHSRQHKYVPLHAIRPMSFWRECLGGLPEDEWHPTIRHALTVASSFCLIGKYSFRGVWPEATLFVRGVYLGSELIMVGDTVRLAPTESKRSVTDVMIVSSIRLRFIKLDQASDDDYDGGRPYLTCLHICGKTFTLDPKRSSDGIARAPVKAGENGLPKMFQGYGQWFHADDPTNEKAKLEVPYHRVLGRCFEDTAVKAWFSTPTDMPPPPSSFQAVNQTLANKVRFSDISQGLQAAQEARKYSREHDSRIDKASGKTWYWAETRIEQLDLHEVNGAFVGVKDETRSKKQFNAWRQALKVMDGTKGGLEEYHAARNQRREEEKRRESAQVTSSSWGLMGSAVQANSIDTDNGETSGAMEDVATGGSAREGDPMDMDDEEEVPQQAPELEGVVDLTHELDDEDDMYD